MTINGNPIPGVHHTNDEWELIIPREWQRDVLDRLANDEESLPFYRLTTDDLEWMGGFLHEWCWAIASVLNHELGWPVTDMQDADGTSFHVMTRTPDGRLLDAEGLWTEAQSSMNWASRPYGLGLDGSPLPTLDEHENDWEGFTSEALGPKLIDHARYEDSGWVIPRPGSYAYKELQLRKTPEMVERILDILNLDPFYQEEISKARTNNKTRRQS